MPEFTDKVALITGGATGIGFAAAQKLAAQGAMVALCGNDEQALTRAVAALRQSGAAVLGCTTDVSVSDQVKTAVHDTVKRFGGLDIVVNSAAVQPYGSVDAMAESVWDRVIAVNLKSIYLTGHYAIPAMRKRGGGAIVNVASVQGLACQTRVAAYAASKGGVLALTRAMALDHAADGIRVNAVCPGSVDTPMLRFAAAENKGSRSDDEIIKAWGRMHPLGRVGRAEEVAELIAFLAGPRGGFCSGGEYKIDGGLMAKLAVVLPD